MSEFEYSTDALNAKNAFLRTSTIIYVEGDDDVPFWHEVFSQIPDFSFAIESRGGSNELEKYINLIEKGELNAVAACDADYRLIIGKKRKCPKIVYTLGYSIENTLYTEHSIHALTKSWCKAPTLTSASCVEWLQNFTTSFRPLLIQDIANSQAGTGLQVLLDNCGQFMNGKHSSSPCKTKVAAKVKEIQTKLPNEIIENISTKIDSNPGAIALAIRGHFLASAVARFINRQASALNKKISLSNDGLYTSAITHFSGHYRENHPHYQHYSDAALAARNALHP